MTWEELKEQKRQEMLSMYYNNHRYVETDVECPCCGSHLWRDDGVVLTSMPPKKEYQCRNCDWYGYA